MLWKYCTDIIQKHGIKVGGVNKLIKNIGNKSKYVVHCRNLHLYLSLRMKLSKVHKVLKFKQSDWLKDTLILIQKKKSAANIFEKKSFKMVINSIYGTAIENLRKRINVILVNNGKVYEKHVSKPSFVSHNFFSKYLAATHEVKLVLTLDKPIHVGFSILDSSKLILYDYHWKAIKRKLDAKLLLTDTDSLIYEIKTKDIYEYFYEDKYSHNFSNYPEDSRFYDHSKMNEIGKMKEYALQLFYWINA